MATPKDPKKQAPKGPTVAPAKRVPLNHGAQAGCHFPTAFTGVGGGGGLVAGLVAGLSGGGSGGA